MPWCGCCFVPIFYQRPVIRPSAYRRFRPLHCAVDSQLSPIDFIWFSHMGLSLKFGLLAASRSACIGRPSSPLLLEVVGIDALDFHHAFDGDAEIVFDHQFGKALSVDERERCSRVSLCVIERFLGER